MPEKTQQKSYVQRFDDLMNEVAVNAATKQDVKEVMDIFVDKYRELMEVIIKKTAENRDEMSTETKRLGEQVADFEKRLRKLVDTKEGGLKSELDILRNEMLAQTGYVESLIEYYDDTELREKIEEVGKLIPEIPEIPEQFDATDILETLESHEKDIEALKNRPTGTIGGGITDRHVQQAMSRIVKTETPTGTFDGVNTDFEVTSSISAILSFELNSRVVDFGTYTITGSARKTISFDTAPSADYSDSQFAVVYV